MTKPYFILLLIILLALTGCTMMPDHKRPPASVTAQYPGATRTDESRAANIPRLKKLTELALTNNLDFRVAMLNVEQSQAQYRITRSASFPAVDGSGSFNCFHVTDVGDCRNYTGVHETARFFTAPYVQMGVNLRI